MPYAAPRPCRYAGCAELVTGRDGFCEQHRKAEHRRYNRTRPNHHKLYRSPRWRSLRDAHIDDNPFCTRCGRLAEIVHHKAPHMGDAELFYDPGNLEALCTVCHNKEHRRGAAA